MNYYSHHIGDYLTDTAHLSILEDGSYRRLLDRYYATEQPLSCDEQILFRLLRARSEDEKEAVRVVLAEFFVLTDAGWSHKRCDAEIKKWRSRGWFPSEGKKLRQSIDEWKITRLRIFFRDRYICTYCKLRSKNLECDHIIPVSRGGSNDDSNLTTACRKCNRRKSNKLISEF
jgi:uncharacterized protein YdaU (DUF1376 family)